MCAFVLLAPVFPAPSALGGQSGAPHGLAPARCTAGRRDGVKRRKEDHVEGLGASRCFPSRTIPHLAPA